jgi:DNA-binding winged helix-turn-helix (wHTH) protein/Tol biopolymer transport system component
MMGQKSFNFRFEEYEVSEHYLRITRAGKALALEPKALRVLIYLLHNPGRLVTKDELLNAVWGDTAVTENSLTRAVALLRKVLDDDIRDPRFLVTIPTAGYRFIAQVAVSENSFIAHDPVSEPVELAANAAPSSPSLPEPIATGRQGQPTLETGRSAVRIRKLVIPVAVALIAVIGFVIWYLNRPQLSRLRVTAYTQITHDGHIGPIAGTDGSRIYFNTGPSGPPAQVGRWGGEIVKIPTGSIHGVALDLSSDGGNLLLWSSDPDALWTMRTLGGPLRFITNYHASTYSFSFPAWSPDARYIAYSDIYGVLEVMRSDGTDVHKLATFKGEITDLAWSPDGDSIRLTVDDALWEISSTGGNLHRVLPDWKGPVGQCCGRWTFDGDFFLFLAGGNTAGASIGGFEQIWVLSERHPPFRRLSSTPVQLTSGPIHWGVPIPSRDGKRIFAVGSTPRAELVRFDSKSKELQPFLGGISAEFLSFSRDRSQIAYVTYPDGILWRAKADGTDRVQITTPPLHPLLCSWSPDGSQILFTAQRTPSRYALYIVSAQGGPPHLLLPPDDIQDQMNNTLSPDGRRVVYQIYPRLSLRIYDLDSGRVSDVPGSAGLYSPRWSPDGRYIAAFTVPSTSIKIFDFQTQRWSVLTQHTGPWEWPTWSHDSKFIYALSVQQKFVHRFPLSGGPAERVVDLKDVSFIGYFDHWFGLDPNDTPLLLRNSGTSDIYALTLER